MLPSRQDFPVLETKVNGKPIVYLDSACMSLKPRQVVEAMDEYYGSYTACHGRSVHHFAQKTTDAVAEARDRVARLINSKAEETVWTRNTTEGINLVARSFLKPGDTVLTTDIEHNSNLLPWLNLRKSGVKHVLVPGLPFNLKDFETKVAATRPKLVSLVHTSNVFGTTIPAKQAIKISHDHGAAVLLDAAQSVPHLPVDVKSLDVDFLAFSGHKALGPTGTGVLYGKAELLESLEPFLVGGETVTDSTYEGFTLERSPAKFEAGLQNYAGIIGLGAAAEYLRKLGMKNVEAYDCRLTEKLFRVLGSIAEVGFLNPDWQSSISLASFNLGKFDPHEVAILLDEVANIFVRSGRHCVHSWFNAHGIKGSVRASLYLYNTEEEIEKLGETLKLLIGGLA